jgi:hypothetical protein
MGRVRPDKANWRPDKRASTVLGAALVVFALAVASLCCFLGVQTRADVVRYYEMARGNFHPIWKDLALGRIRKGDSLKSLLQKHRPTQRVDFGPYTSLCYRGPGSSGTLQIRAKNARLIYACAGSECWEHVFFAAPEEEAAFSQARTEYWQQIMLEWQAYRIHRVITAGQDVFLSRRVQRTQVRDDPNDPKYRAELQQMREVYGPAYLEQGLTQAYLEEILTHLELTVEVNEVLSGDLQPGTVLKFRGDDCGSATLDEPEIVFLHVKDSRLLWSHSKGGEAYTTVPRQALDRYRSLTPEEIKKLETLRQRRSARTVK